MLQGERLDFYKRKLLVFLDMRPGIEVRESQLVTDMQVSVEINARREDVVQALHALKDQAHATRRMTDFTGFVWNITPSGHEAAAKLALED